MKKRLRAKRKREPTLSISLKVYPYPIGILEICAECGGKSYAASFPHPSGSALNEELLKEMAMPKIEKMISSIREDLYE